MRSLKGKAILDKDEAIKGLWDSIEAMLKAVKTLVGKPGAAAARKSQTSVIETSLSKLQELEGFSVMPGTIVKIFRNNNDDQWIVARFEGIQESDSGIDTCFSMIAATEKFGWSDSVKENFDVTLSVFSNADRVETLELEDLPTLVGSHLECRLLQELLKG